MLRIVLAISLIASSSCFHFQQFQIIRRSQVMKRQGWDDTSKSIWELIIQSSPAGQTYGIRKELHHRGARRSLTDKMVWTHLFFVIASLYSYHYRIFDLLILNTITTLLSFLYHIRYEKPGFLARLEGISAKLLFLYGFIQIFRVPNLSLALLEICCLCLTLIVFIKTNLNKDLYEPYHYFMHIIPPVWTMIVSMFHSPLFALRVMSR